MEATADRPSSLLISDNLRDLSARILHPDILLQILTHLEPTHLPSLIRCSRYLHNLAGPILYSDLPFPPLTPSALCPHLSPIASLFLASSPHTLPPSLSDLRAVLRDNPSRKRTLLESAKTLRIHAHHAHTALPAPIQLLKLDMRKVHTLHLVGGGAICCSPKPNDGCTFFTNLRPKIVILESTSINLGHIGGLSHSANQSIEHLVIRLKPSQGGSFPLVDVECSNLSHSLRRLTVVFDPNPYLGRDGRVVVEKWKPSSRSVCGEYYWEDKLSFRHLVAHLVESTVGLQKVDVVGSELLDREWVEAGLSRQIAEGRDENWISKRMLRVCKEYGGGDNIQFHSMAEWRAGTDGGLLDIARISSGQVGKGVGRRMTK